MVRNSKAPVTKPVLFGRGIPFIIHHGRRLWIVVFHKTQELLLIPSYQKKKPWWSRRYSISSSSSSSSYPASPPPPLPTLHRMARAAPAPARLWMSRLNWPEMKSSVVVLEQSWTSPISTGRTCRPSIAPTMGLGSTCGFARVWRMGPWLMYPRWSWPSTAALMSTPLAMSSSITSSLDSMSTPSISMSSMVGWFN